MGDMTWQSYVSNRENASLNIFMFEVMELEYTSLVKVDGFILSYFKCKVNLAFSLMQKNCVLCLNQRDLSKNKI